MLKVMVEGVGISASCPGEVKVGVMTRIQGDVSYHLINGGGEDEFVNTLLELVDTVGHAETQSETSRRLRAGETIQENQTMFLNVSYEQAGSIGVTMRLSLSGATTASYFAECSLVVNGRTS